MNEQQQVWLFYLSKQLFLKYSFDIVDLTKSSEGYSEMNKTFNMIGFKWYWENIEVLSFDDFISKNGMYGYDWFKDIFYREKKT